MNGQQLDLFKDVGMESCIFKEQLEDDDHHCFIDGQTQDNYECLYCGHPDLDRWLQDINGIGFTDLIPQSTPQILLPDYIPVIRQGSGKLFTKSNFPYIAITLDNLVLYKTLPQNIHKWIGVDPNTKVILLNYGKDRRIETIWPNRNAYYSYIASAGFSLVTGINYSIWDRQPHAERLINIKRGLMTFVEMQEYGIPVIPHIYWYGMKDICRTAEWINNNPQIEILAIDLQTIRRGKFWEKTILEIAELNKLLTPKKHFIVTGPTSFQRVNDIKRVLPSFTLTNSKPARRAACGILLGKDGKDYYMPGHDKSDLLIQNTSLFSNMLSFNFQNRQIIP